VKMDYKLPNGKMKNIMYGGGIREILALADELQCSGRDIIHMEIGRPDFDSPQNAKDAAARALQSGDVHYTDMSGTPELRSALAAKYKRDAGMDIDPDREIIVTAGAVEALMTLFMTILDPGDEVIIPSPYFPVYDDQIKMAGGTLKNIPCHMKNGFRPQARDIENAVTSKTRIILINTPNNPTGATSTRVELEGIAEVAKKYDLLVISDECYEKFTYDADTPHISIASLDGMRGRTFTLSAASKTFSMTGWRVGWMVIPSDTRKFIMKCHQAVTTCSNSFAQAGVAEALRSCQPDVSLMIDEYKRRRDLMVGMFSEIKGIEVHMPKGAFYVFPNIKALGLSSFDFCSRLIEETGVATVPGQPFGAEDGYVRLTYCRPENEIKEAMKRIAKFVSKL
jgi:aspartate aminotransferase/aminotransferase